MKLKFDVTAKEYGILRDILTDMLPPDSRVWVFGSRAKNTVRFNSDIDLALEPAKGKPLPKDTIARLKDAFNDAPLPYRVDVLDINDISENFQTIIRRQAIAFPLAKSDKVPALRFPEFRDAGDWEVKRLGEVAVFKKGKGISKADIIEDGKNLCIRYGELYTEYNEVIKIIVSRTNTEVGSSILSEKNDILMPTSDVTPNGLATASALNETGIILGGDILIIRSQKILNLFFCYFVASHKNKIMRLVSGVTVYHIYGSDMATLHVNVPSLSEQQKIANFLSAIDTKIAQITKKKALLEQYKRGVMQKLFSGELRFKDAQGKAFPDWVEKRLGEVAVFKKGKGISKADIIEDGKNLCIRYGELYTEYNEVIKIIVSRTNTEVGSSILSEKNDILMPTSDVTPNGLATASALNETGIILGGDILIIRSQKILNLFFCYFVASHKNKIMRLVSGVTVYHIYGSDMATLHVNVPSLSEQQKIADFLSSIDQKINLIATELERTQTFKKGLLQQMFV